MHTCSLDSLSFVDSSRGSSKLLRYFREPKFLTMQATIDSSSSRKFPLLFSLSSLSSLLHCLSSELSWLFDSCCSIKEFLNSTMVCSWFFNLRPKAQFSSSICFCMQEVCAELVELANCFPDCFFLILLLSVWFCE